MHIFTKKIQTYAVDGQQLAYHNEKRLAEGLDALDMMELAPAERELAQAALELYYLGFYENLAHPLVGSIALAARQEDWPVSLTANALALLQSAEGNKAPASAAEAAFRDAAALFFASPKFLKRLEALHQEAEQAAGVSLDKMDWYRAQLEKIEAQQFFTAYGQTTLAPALADNRQALQKQLKKWERQLDQVLIEELEIDAEKLKTLKKRLVKAEGSPERGIETWFRTASANLYTRRQIVDTKSNIMITMNAIIISVMLGSIYPQLSSNPHLIWAITPMILTSLASIAFAIFATRPKLADGIFTKEQVLDKTARLTTFDDFYQVPLADYEWAVHEMLEDRKFLYATLIRDMHRLGLDLAIRYKNIRLSYQVFLIGLILSLVSFGLCHIML